MFDDKKFGCIFPTRTGTATGTANERQMLDAVGGSESFRTRIQNNADGSTTMLRTKNGMPQFTTVSTGRHQTQTVSMDSGTVDIQGVAEMSPYRFADGIIHYGENQHAEFSAQRLLGKIKPPSISNLTPPPDATVSKAFQVLADAFGERNSDATNILWLKKICLGQVPASIFCGKTRLYVQAQYGADLDSWEWTPILGAPPSLRRQGVSVTTNSGVYTDDLQRHWLLDLSGGGLQVTRLKSLTKVEPLRDLLSLAGVDHERIEAYILAYSYPDQTMSFSIPVPDIPGSDMFGYGWHFNWDGTKADIIITEEYPTGVDFSIENKSTHYRVTVGRSSGTATDVSQEKSKWSVSLTTVEGPVTWKNPKWTQVIASPIWEDGVLFVFGSLWGRQFGNAPIYCFYKRNELEVIRFTHIGGDAAIKYRRSASPVTFGGAHEWSTSRLQGGFLSIGLDPCSSESQSRMNEPVTTGFIGTVSTVTTTTAYTYTRATLSKSWQGVANWYSGGGVNPYNTAMNGKGTYTSPAPSLLSDGVPFYQGGIENPPYTSCPGAAMWSYQMNMTYNAGTYSGSYSESARSVIIIPFYDAEAVYVYGIKSFEKSETGYTASVSMTHATKLVNVHRWIKYPYDGSNYEDIVSYRGDSVPQIVCDIPDDSSSSSTSIVASSLITSSGVYAFTPPESMSPFFAGEPNETVSQTYATWASCEGAVFGHGAENLMGFTHKSPFIGWA